MPDPARKPLPVSPGAVHRVRIRERDARGRGVAALGRRELRVAGALPGEEVDVRLVHVGRHVAVGRIAQVVAPAPARVRDACPHGEVCPGCGMRTTRGTERREFLRGRLTEALSFAGIETRVGSTVGSAQVDGWRHKAYLVPRRTRRGVRLGLFEEGTHRLVEIAGCPAHAPAVERALRGVREAIARCDPAIYDERRRTGRLRGVSVRASLLSGEALVVLVVVDREGDDASLAEAIRSAAPHVRGVVRNVHGEPGNAPYGREFETLWGADSIEEGSGDLRLRVSAASFFQVNPALASRLHDDAAAACARAGGERALDLFGGVGATALRLAGTFARVVLVEESPWACADAAFNAGRAGLSSRVEVREGRVERALPEIEASVAAVVVNPPRAGLSEPVLEGLIRLRPAVLAYVSCDPTTLARDLAAMERSGMRVDSATPYEMMPQTPHLEALAVLSRGT